MSSSDISWSACTLSSLSADTGVFQMCLCGMFVVCLCLCGVCVHDIKGCMVCVVLVSVLTLILC